MGSMACNRGQDVFGRLCIQVGPPAVLSAAGAMIIPLLAVGIVWGATNVLMKRGSAGINDLPAAKSGLHRLFQDLLFLLSRPLYVASFLGNMCGSVLFYYTLSHGDVSLVGPIVNALTFIFTTAFGAVFEKEHVSLGTCRPLAYLPINLDQARNVLTFIHHIASDHPCRKRVWHAARYCGRHDLHSE